MSSSFYISIIEEEKNAFNIKDEALKKAAKDVSKTYSVLNLQKGSTFLDYNLPSNRCAYLFKYATVHTGVVAKYFRKLTKKKEVKRNLCGKKEIKICCLGGGPGTDIVGIFKTLALFPYLHQKVVQVTVLDLCGGWRNSFKHIISRLKHGKVDGVPASFIDSTKFKADLIAVDLLKPLPDNIKKVISSADVLSMVKFVSAVLGKQESINALKAIGSLTKPGATILFIDNFQGKVFEPLEDVSQQCGFNLCLGPLHEVFARPVSTSKKSAYGCLPLQATRISVIGWIKTPVTLMNECSIPISSPLTSNSNEDDSWDTESESEDSSVQLPTQVMVKSFFLNSKPIEASFSNIRFDKSTQTNAQYLSTPESKRDELSDEIAELPNLLEAISDLLRVMKQLGKYNTVRKHCCKCCS